MEESVFYKNQTNITADNSGQGKNFPESSEKVDSHENIYQTLEMNTAGTSLSGDQDVKKKSHRIATVCLGLLCALLLAGLIVLAVLYTTHISEWKSGCKELHINNNNITEEKNQLQTSYNNLASEKQQLQTSLEQLTSWRNDLPRRLQAHSRWVYFSGSFYFVSSLERSWNEGRADCQSRGADLMIFNSRGEQDFARTFKKRLWVGLTDSESQGIWKWVDGTPLTTSYWAPGEPNGGHEHCAETMKYDLENSLNDAPCSVQYYWICEKRFEL